jgi:hypothetical protein
VCLEVIDCHERHFPDQRQRLGRTHPHQQRTDQTGALRRRDGVDRILADPCLDHRLCDHRDQHFDMCATRYLWNYATETGMNVDLR